MIPKEFKQWMISNNISVVDMDWRKLRNVNIDFKEVLDWEKSHEYLFNKDKPKASDIKKLAKSITPSDINHVNNLIEFGITSGDIGKSWDKIKELMYDLRHILD